jgi:hypothetical protein
MSAKLPTTLWAAINRAKLDLRKYHLEQDPTKKEKLRTLAIRSIKNTDEVIGSGPHKFQRSQSRHLWRNEILYLNNDINNETLGPYWQDTKEHWSLDSMPEWAFQQPIKIQEPQVGTPIVVQGKTIPYPKRVIYDHDR